MPSIESRVETRDLRLKPTSYIGTYSLGIRYEGRPGKGRLYIVPGPINKYIIRICIAGRLGSI